MLAFDLPQCAVCAGGRSDRLVKNEYLGCHVRLEVVVAEERNYSTTGQLLDRSAEVGFHHLPEESASLVNVVLASVLDQGLLRVTQNAVHDREDDVAAVDRDRAGRPAMQLLGCDPDQAFVLSRRGLRGGGLLG